MTNSRPLRLQFERQVKRVQADVLRMGALVETSCSLAFQAIFEQNLTAATAIIAQEIETDRLYHHIEANCIGIITLQAPVANDMRLLSAMLQLVRDLERIGDYAQEIGQLATKLFTHPPAPCLSRLRGMFERVQMMLSLSLLAITNLDATVGNDLRELDQVVNSDYESLYQTLAQGLEIPATVEPNLVLVLIIRNLERMADHAANIGQRIAFITQGERNSP
ncbi:phosphate signaling complex protein PhoU [Thermosynechococcaceae cyanobacterium BACA0444]|uniref:Phosphate-specific transport system accessory protein PhoU n=1 Tax=Pseudocalidococcus azoricus BACA0444 TaxID=2918990 RepID=A0AAE4FQP9_9CYAN|nr:phosphate signaling complex protein PhoU [Pseudocalidococcus azoricus]MDS3860416.1 phosphate signaling complex protein PhoU [Pseudocalidococcus azoricus BACA0444]